MKVTIFDRDSSGAIRSLLSDLEHREAERVLLRAWLSRALDELDAAAAWTPEVRRERLHAVVAELRREAGIA